MDDGRLLYKFALKAQLVVDRIMQLQSFMDFPGKIDDLIKLVGQVSVVVILCSVKHNKNFDEFLAFGRYVDFDLYNQIKTNP